MPTAGKSGEYGLLADIGGTYARFALADRDGVYHPKVLKCASYPTMTDAVRSYLKDVKPAAEPRVASFAVAGVPMGDTLKVVNNPWEFSIQRAKQELALRYFEFMNDFKAIALAVPHLKPDMVRQVGSGTSVPRAPIGIIGPGTGLGMAALVWNGTEYIAVPGEGGHATVPAATQREFDVFQVLRQKYRHISAERVCSGKGLVNLYDALRQLDSRADLPGRTPEDISAAAIRNDCKVCVEALEMMMEFLGTMAGNLALTLGAQGGIYFAGGIIRNLGDWFYHSIIREKFTAKGRMEDYLSPIPTFVVREEFPAFIGLHQHLKKHLG